MSASDDPGVRLMIFDRTCRGPWYRLGLSHVWWTGAHLYRGLGRLDACRGVSSWNEGLKWLAEFQPDRPIAEVQYWGHGKWGLARVDRQPLDIDALEASHELYPLLRRVRVRMRPASRGLWWFRTCETFGARPGHRFARALADFLGCRVAGHTFIIGHWQSGLHTIMPGQEPHWSDTEGLEQGSPESPERAHWSSRHAPNTITFLHGRIPEGY